MWKIRVSFGNPGLGLPFPFPPAKPDCVYADERRIVTMKVTATKPKTFFIFGLEKLFPVIEIRLIIAFKELLFFDTNDLFFFSFNESFQNNLLLKPCVYHLFLTIMTIMIAIQKISY